MQAAPAESAARPADAPRRDRQHRHADPAGARQRRPARTRSTRSPPRWPASTPRTSSTRTTRMPADRRRAARRRDRGRRRQRRADRARPVPARPPVAAAGVRGHASSAPSATATHERQGRPRAPRPLARLGQRRRHHAADRLDQHAPGQPAADVHAQLHQRRPEHRDQRGLQGDGQRHQRSAARPWSRRPPPGSRPPARSRCSSSPPAGSYTVTATVEPVPGEKNTANNTLTFPVTFQ